MKGTIEVRPISVLKNKLVLVYRWSKKDYTDTDHYEKEYLILREQVDEIITKDLIGKEVEFVTFHEYSVYKEELSVVKIIFPPIEYTEDEIHDLVLKAWNDGYINVKRPDAGERAENGPDAFWEKNKKKK